MCVYKQNLIIGCVIIDRSRPRITRRNTIDVSYKAVYCLKTNNFLKKPTLLGRFFLA